MTVVLKQRCPFKPAAIAQDSGIRDQAKCLVIGIERGNTSIQNPPPSTVFEKGDIVWIVGEHKQAILLSEGKILSN